MRYNPCSGDRLPVLIGISVQASHFSANGGVSDQGGRYYRRAQAEAVALKNPSLAVKNSASYEFFAVQVRDGNKGLKTVYDEEETSRAGVLQIAWNILGDGVKAALARFF